jgi:hypothetical protein
MSILVMLRIAVLSCFASLGLVLGGSEVYQIQAQGNSKLCLDVLGGKSDNGTPIDVWTCSSIKGQQWHFDPGTYKLRSAIDPNKCIDAGDMKQGTGLVLNDCDIQPQQFWSYSSKTSTIYLEATTGGTTMCMDIKDAAYKAGTRSQVWTCDGLANQGWTISVPPPPPRPFQIKVAGSNFCLDLYSKKTDNGTPIDAWTCANGEPGQQWLFVDGGYKLQSVVDPKKCIDAQGMNLRDTLKIWDCNSQPQQTWGFDDKQGAIFLGKDPKKASLCMCLTDFKNGAPIQLYTCNGQSPEKWTISDAPKMLEDTPQNATFELV